MILGDRYFYLLDIPLYIVYTGTQVTVSSDKELARMDRELRSALSTGSYWDYLDKHAQAASAVFARNGKRDKELERKMEEDRKEQVQLWKEFYTAIGRIGV